MKKLLIIILFLINVISLKAWFVCKDIYAYHFSPLDLRLQLIEAIHTDYGPIFITRFFHNKPVLFVLDVYKRYTHFLDINLLVALLSFAGFVGLLFGFWYFLRSKKKNLYLWILFFVAFAFPLIDVIFNLPLIFSIKIVLISLPFCAISLYGHWNFMKRHNARLLLIIYSVLFAVSIAWILDLHTFIYGYCVK